MQRMDVHAVLGQSTSKELIVKGDQFARRVKCFTSHPGEMQFYPGGAFQLVAGAFNKVDVVFRPLSLASQSLLVHMVDVDSHVTIPALC